MFCTRYDKEHIFQYKIKKTAAHCSFFPIQFIGHLTQRKLVFFSVTWGSYYGVPKK